MMAGVLILQWLLTGNYYRFAYKRQIVNDGNFKAQNSHSGRPDQDICLYDGEAYMVAEQPYQDYLSKVPSRKEVTMI